jgi:uncharacterized protein YjbI with pentapeptide repeats
MKDPEQLEILLLGAAVWNNWREEKHVAQPNLEGADLRNADLSDCYLRDSNLVGANFRNARLLNANLNYAKLDGTDFGNADLKGAVLSAATLTDANFNGARLVGTNLMHANLQKATFVNTVFADTRFDDAHVGRTLFAGTDLRQLVGLDGLWHAAPSTLDIETFKKSYGQISETFLRGCGLSDWEIENVKLYQPGLNNEQINDILYAIHGLRASQAIQINPLFLSYSHKDSDFVDALELYLNRSGIRFWRDVHHATAGRLEAQVDRAIRLNPTVLLVLSEHAIESDWVQHEVRLARRLELETKRDVLCPIALDAKWKEAAWPKRIKEQIMEYNILDFSKWGEPPSFLRMFHRLIEGLDLFYKEKR